MQSLLLLLSSLQTHCKTIGNGLLLPDYLVYLKYSLSSLSTHSKLFSNLASRFQAVLDRYASLRKMTTKSPVLNDAVSSLSPLSDASFDWDSYVPNRFQITYTLQRTFDTSAVVDSAYLLCARTGENAQTQRTTVS